MIAQKSKNSKYVSLVLGVAVAFLSVWQISGRSFEVNNRLRKAAKKAVLVPVIYSSGMTVISMHISQCLINQ